jgi:predicted transcriptional regulator
MESQDRLLSQREAAKRIGITRQAISHAVINNLIAYEKIDSFRLIRESVALAYKKNRPSAGWKKGKKRNGK